MTMNRPREVVQRLIEGVTQREWGALPGLYADDAVVEQPFAIPAPIRLVGREQLRAHFQAASRAPFELRATNVVFHDSDDPEVVIVEYEYEGRVTSTGHSFRVANIQVVRVRDGQIVGSRDYHNHQALADAARGLATAATRD